MNVLLTGAWQGAETHIDEIQALGHNVLYMKQETDELPCPYSWVEGVVCNGLFLTHPIERFENLRYIQLTSAGYDRVPMEYVKGKNIEIHNAKGVYSIPMAEFAVGGILQIYKQSRCFFENQKAHKWEKHRGLPELDGKTVCIVGCGSVGTECAKRLKAFGCKIIGIDIKPYTSEWFDEMHSLDSLNEILKNSDIVILTLPLSEETFHLMNAARLNMMKTGALLVNIARGKIVDTGALFNELRTKRLYAVLDVFEEEPLDHKSDLWDLENVIITPHNSFVGIGNAERLAHAIITNLEERT